MAQENRHQEDMDTRRAQVQTLDNQNGFQVNTKTGEPRMSQASH